MTDSNSDNNNQIIIEGVTKAGKRFRPSDWAERMSGKLSTFKNRRVQYSPLLRPGVKDGNKCVLIDPRLQDSNPKLYNSLMKFAKENNLNVCGQPSDESDKNPQQ